MKNIILLFLIFSISAQAQIEKVWEVKVPNVLTGADIRSMRDDIMSNGQGTVMIDFRQYYLGKFDPTVPETNYTKLVWITSDGKLKFAWNGDNGIMPSFGDILIFNDDYLVTTQFGIHSGGRLIIWEVVDGAISRKHTDTEAAIWFVSHRNANRYGNLDGDNTFYGLSGDPDAGPDNVMIYKYRLQSKSQAFTVQQSEDLKTWQDLIQVPKGDASKEFYRIAPEE